MSRQSNIPPSTKTASPFPPVILHILRILRSQRLSFRSERSLTALVAQPANLEGIDLDGWAHLLRRLILFVVCGYRVGAVFESTKALVGAEAVVVADFFAHSLQCWWWLGCFVNVVGMAEVGWRVWLLQEFSMLRLWERFCQENWTLYRVFGSIIDQI